MWVLSVQDGMYALGKAHMGSTPSVRSFPSVAFETVPVFLIDDGLLFPRPSPPGGRWCDVLGFVPAGVSQAPQHFRSSETQATYEGCFARQYICSVIPLPPIMSRVVQCTHRSFLRWMSTIATFQSGLPIPLFVASSSHLWGWWHVWSDCHLWRWEPAQGMGDFCIYVTCINAWWGVLFVYFCLN